MKAIRRFLGILVMIAGILGLVLSLAGLVGLWVVKPTFAGYVDTTILTLNTSVNTSQQAMVIAGETLNAAVDSVDALSTMLSNTAASVEDTQPVFDQINLIMSETLPSTLQSVNDSLTTAQQAAEVLDSTIKSLDTFRILLSATPLIGGLVESPQQPYNPEVPLADSLGELATNLSSLPEAFIEMSTNLDKTDDNLVAIQSNLTTMSESIGQISVSLSNYETMIVQSETSVGNVLPILTNIQDNLPNILNGAAIVLSLFFLWLLAAQVVILSQGWELYQGMGDSMESGSSKPSIAELIEESSTDTTDELETNQSQKDKVES